MNSFLLIVILALCGGSYYEYTVLNQAKLEDQQQITDLQAKVKAFRDANQQLSVLVAGDTGGNYGGVYKVLADLQQAGVDKVGLMSTPGDGSSQGQGAHGRP